MAFRPVLLFLQPCHLVGLSFTNPEFSIVPVRLGVARERIVFRNRVHFLLLKPKRIKSLNRALVFEHNESLTCCIYLLQSNNSGSVILSETFVSPGQTWSDRRNMG